MLSPTLTRLPILSTSSLILGFVFVLFASTGDAAFAPVLPAAFVLGIFMFVLTLVTFGIHLVFALMRDHEAWKKNTFNDQ
jgi:hypothetical protein